MHIVPYQINTERFGVVLTRELTVLALLEGNAKHFHPLKGGA